MILLAIGLGLFFVAHLSGLAPATKAQLRDRLGTLGFRGVYSLVSLVGLVLIVLGYQAADPIPVYTPPAWAPKLAHAVMPFAIILVAGANMPSNLRRFIRHPMSLGVFLWAATHLTANGSVPDLLLFGSFAVYALIDALVVRTPKPAPPKQPARKDLILVIAGLVAYGAIFYVHNQLIYISG